MFPTGIDRRDDIGAPDRFDVYYGMADNRIGVVRLDVPETPAPEGYRVQFSTNGGLTPTRQTQSIEVLPHGPFNLLSE